MLLRVADRRRTFAGVWLTLVLALTLAAHGSARAQSRRAEPQVSAGEGKLFIGTYGGDIRVVDEATGKVEERIPLKVGLARSLLPSADRTRFYVLDSTYEKIEVIDIATRKSLRDYSLREGNRRLRVISMVADPTNQYLILLTRLATKLIDRWEIGPAQLQQFDLATGRITRTIPWPRGEERETVNLRFSSDGSSLFMFGDEVIILDTRTFAEVESWPLSTPSESGVGRITLGPVHDFYDEPGTFTGLFVQQDPIQKRRIMGIGRVNLTARSVDFKPLGPAENVSFAQAPDRKRAYGIKTDIGRWEFWTFDLEKGSVISRGEFQSRPRVVPRVSSNGKVIYVYVAGDTIDLYEAATYRYLRTIHLNADQTTEMFVVPPAAPSRTAR